MIIDFTSLDTKILTQNALRIKDPPNISLPEYKPPKISLKMAISPGLTFGILRYTIVLYSKITKKSP